MVTVTRKPKPSEDFTKFDPETGEQLHDEKGREIPDPTPMQPPIGYTRQPSLAQQIRQQILSANLAEAARTAGAETFEEADDFEVGDDWEDEKHSPYEANFDPMTAEERAALSHKPGERVDPDKVLTAKEKAALSQKPKKQSEQRPAATPLSEPLSGGDQDPSGS